MVQILSEKNASKVDVAFKIFKFTVCTENATWAFQLYALFFTSKRQFQKSVLSKIKRNALVILGIISKKK
jgi:hypothetical protein